MAVQIESQVLLSEFLEILWRRRWQVLLPALIVLTFGVSVAVFIPKKYLVVTQIEVRQVNSGGTGKEAENAPNQIRAVERIRRLLESLKNETYLALGPREQNEFVTDMRDDLKVRVEKPPGATSSFVTIEYAHVNVRWAMEALKALRDDWKRDIIDSDKNRVEDEAQRLNETVAQLELASQQEDHELTRLYQRNNISATQPIPGGKDRRAEDPDFERLQRAKDDLAKVQLDLAGAELGVTDLGQRLADTPERLNEERLLEGVSHSAELLEIEQKITDLNAALARFRPIHPRYGEILEEIDQLEKQREAIKKLATRSEQASISALNPRYTELQHQLEDARLERNKLAAKKKQLEQSIAHDTESVEQLYLVYNEIRWRSANAERLADQLKAATLKRDEKANLARNLASRLNDPFSILQEVTEPLKPTEPNPWLIVAFALVAGLALGLALALSSEYGRNCFRSVHDVSRVMVAPVLGTIGKIVTSRQRRMRTLKSAAVGTLSATLICAVAFVTWAWARNPELLSPQLRARIDQIRHKLR